MTKATPPLPLREHRQRTAPRRGLALREAALYLGIGPRKFSLLVAQGRAPAPRLIGESPIWDKEDLDRYIDRLPQRGSTPVSGGMLPPLMPRRH